MPDFMNCFIISLIPLWLYASMLIDMEKENKCRGSNIVKQLTGPLKEFYS